MLLITILAALFQTASSQTWTACNPLSAQCPADPALGKSIDIDFTKGASDQLTSSGGGSPSYQSDGVYLTVAKQGDSPTFTSKWYMMFGRVEVKMKAAPGTGIVSSLVLQSDDLDEIDFEWIGGDAAQVQSNYFGKGQTTSYNRGGFHANPNNHDWHTYSIDFTSQQVVWAVDGQTVRVLTPATAEANQFPQTPMQLKFGIWAGGDSSNNPGTIAWAGGSTNYAGGPYSMVVADVKATDYSTGTSYSYSGSTGTWQSIKSNGGTIFGGSSNAGSSAGSSPSSVTEPKLQAPSSASSLQQAPSSSSAALATSTSILEAQPTTTIPVEQPDTTAQAAQPTAVPPTQAGSVTTVVYDNKGFPTTIVVPQGWTKQYNAQGFVILPTDRDGTAKRQVAAISSAAASGLSAVSSLATAMNSATTSVSMNPSSTLTTRPVSSSSTSSTTASSSSTGVATNLNVVTGTSLLSIILSFLLA